jgi:hypothetical protein
VRRRSVLKFVRRVGPYWRNKWRTTSGCRWRRPGVSLTSWWRRGLRAVEIAGLKFYFVNPKEVAEVILGSIKPD